MVRSKSKSDIVFDDNHSISKLKMEVNYNPVYLYFICFIGIE